MEPNTSSNNAINATPDDFNNSAPIVVPGPKKSKGLIITSAIFAVLAAFGIGFGVYGLLDANQKATQISDLESELSNLKTDIENKNTEITNLENTLSDLSAENENVEVVEPETGEDNGTATIMLGSILDESETHKTFKIGECTADSGTAASGGHLSVKCHVTTPGGDTLISYHDDDIALRLTLPKGQ